MPETLSNQEINALLNALITTDELQNKKKKRILLVDNTDSTRMMCKDILEKNGYEVCGEVADSIEVIEKYKELKPDLTIINIDTLRADMLTALKEIKKHDRKAKVVILSDYDSESSILEAVKCGSTDYIAKPFQDDNLISGISAVLNKIITDVKKERILLVDDAAFMRMMQKDILEKNGYEVCGEANDGIEAIAKYKELKPDLTILDITMPNMDGLTALKEIKKDDPEAKILMVSAMGMESYVVDSIRNGASDFIVKPFSADKMIAGVYAVLNKKMPVIPEEHINDWHRHNRYKNGSNSLSQEEIDEIVLSYILFAQNLNTSKTDSLTGCLSIQAFDGDFDEMLKEAEKKYEDITLVMLDIDNFKRVNDEFGHQTGDDILREIAKVLLDISLEHKTYRYSGDCFALLFPNVEKEQVFLIMEETRKKIAEAPECSRTSMTISAGIATYLEDGNGNIEIIRKAEGALYRAKTSGRNKVALAKEEKLVTKTAHYTVEQLKRLEKLAEKKKISEAALMREALDELLKKYNK